jgi:hypothetical protein
VCFALRPAPVGATTVRAGDIMNNTATQPLLMERRVDIKLREAFDQLLQEFGRVNIELSAEALRLVAIKHNTTGTLDT